MGRIQSSVGLITGIPISETVDQLLAVSAQPRDLLISRNEALQAERLAVSELTAGVIGVQFAMTSLGSSSLFARKQTTSSDEELLSVTTTGTPARGTYEITPVRQAQNHQLLSGGFSQSDEPIGAGEISLSFGGFVDKGISLDELNAGNGVERGRIRITDRSGSSAQIDLRFAQTISDVVQQINENNDIDVTARSRGDSIELLDNTGQTISNLKVQEVGAGTTAADLGLAGIDVASASALGEDVLSLHADLDLSRLNDGNGVLLRQGVPDLEVTFGNGSTPLQIEFLAEIKGPTVSSATTEAANGNDAQLTLTSIGIGEEWDGYDIIFENDDDITSGNETVEIDTTSKVVRFQIDAGVTRAVHLVNAINNDDTAKQYFTASISADGDGTGVIVTSDTATTQGGAIEYADETTLGDLIETINAADPARLRAEINAAGDGIDLIDLTVDSAATPATGGPSLWNLGQPIPSGPDGNGTAASGPNLWNLGQPIPNATTENGFSIKSLFGSSVAEDLGFTTPATDGVLRSERRLSGLNTVLLDSLAGGAGLGALGTVAVADRSGNSADIDLSAAETLDQVLDAFNSAGIGISARVNSARNGIELSDTSGGDGNLVVSNGDVSNTADRLQLSIDAAVASVNSGSLNLQTFSEQLTLDSLNNGRGISQGSFLITDSTGGVGAVNLAVVGAQTVGELIDYINGLSGLDVEARVNETGDGLLLLDVGGGEGALTIRDVGNGTAAADLGIAGTSVTHNVGNATSKVIDGSRTVRIDLDDDDTLDDLARKINEAGGDYVASVFNSGSSTKPYRLSITSQLTGSEGELLVDASGLDVRFQELVAAEDALVALGPSDAPIVASVASSASNDFESLIDGVTITVLGTSQESVSVNIEQTDEPVISQLNLFVDQFNELQNKLDELTFFDEIENTTGVLFGRGEALRIEFDFANLITGRFFGAGPIRSLEEVGLSLDGTGKLRFDEEKFSSRYAEDPEAVEKLFTDEEFGVSTKFVDVAQQLAGVDNSLLINRTQTLQRTMELNGERIGSLTAALDAERESLLEEFFRLETAIGKLQNNLAALGRIQALPPLVGNSLGV